MLVIRPPDYFPRLAFFALAARAEAFVVGDTFQYSRQSYQNRARIATPDGTMWLTVPLAGGQHGRPIAEIEIDGRADWRRTHLKALRFNYGSAPFYEEYAARIAHLLDAPYATLGALAVATTELLARLLDVQVPILRASALAGAPATLDAVRAQWPEKPLLALPDTAAHDGAAPLDWREAPRRQPFGAPFRPDCSALDALMMYGPDARRFL